MHSTDILKITNTNQLNYLQKNTKKYDNINTRNRNMAQLAKQMWNDIPHLLCKFHRLSILSTENIATFPNSLVS